VFDARGLIEIDDGTIVSAQTKGVRWRRSPGAMTGLRGWALGGEPVRS
jgi:hypothetical protein